MIQSKTEANGILKQSALTWYIKIDKFFQARGFKKTSGD